MTPKINHFFKPTPKKLILPVIASIFLLFLFSLTYYENSISADYNCRILSIQKDLGKDTGSIFLDTIKFSTKNQYNPENVQLQGTKNRIVASSNKIISTINPFYPVDCSVSQKNRFCGDYSSYEGYECTKKLEEIQPSISEYRKPSIFMLTISILFFFTLFYAFSCLFLMFYNGGFNKY